MPQVVYLVAKPKNSDAWEIWERKKHSISFPMSAEGLFKRWSDISEGSFVEAKLSFNGGVGTLDSVIETVEDAQRHFFWFPEKHLPSSWCCKISDKDGRRHTLGGGWKTTDTDRTWGDFWLRSASVEINHAPNAKPEDGTYPVWLNPIVLRIDLQNDVDAFDEEFVNDENFDIQFVPIWQTDEVIRYHCREKLIKRNIERRCSDSPKSILRDVGFSEAALKSTDLFEILDRIGGTFCIRGFGSGNPNIVFHPNGGITNSARIIGQAIAKKLNYDWCDDPCEKPTYPPLEDYRSHVVRVETHTYDSILTAIEKEVVESEKESLRFIREVRESGGCLDALYPLPDHQIDIFRFINDFATRHVIPRSHILVDFPNGDFEDEANKRHYEPFRSSVFDLLHSHPGGAATYLRRFLLSQEPLAAGIDSRYTNNWESKWLNALYFENADSRFIVTDKGLSARLGHFHLGFSRLGTMQNLGSRPHPIFGPAVESLAKPQ